MNDSQIEHNMRVLGDMHELMEEVLILQKDAEPSTETVLRAREIVAKSEALVENVKASEMIVDGKILSIGGHIARLHVHNYDTNLRSFSAEEYTSGIMAFFEKLASSPNDSWDLLSEQTYDLFKKVPSLNYRLGTFTLDPPPTTEKPKSQRVKKTAEKSKDVISAMDQSEETAAEPTDEIYKNILKCLLRAYKQRGKQPVDYLRFIIDPSDFWKTVQNIFHFSFLVRDNKVQMSQDAAGLPVVEPIFDRDRENQSVASTKSKQFIFRLTPAEWRQFVATLEITEPAIR